MLSFRPAPHRRPRHPPSTGAANPSDLLVRFFAAGIAFLLAAVTASLLHEAGVLADGRWLALHLALLGGVSQLVLGAGQFFVGASMPTGPPRRMLVRAQWGAGTSAPSWSPWVCRRTSPHSPPPPAR